MCDDEYRLDSLIDFERSASLRRGEHGSDAWWRYSYACIYMFRPRCLAGELSNWIAYLCAGSCVGGMFRLHGVV